MRPRTSWTARLLVLIGVWAGGCVVQRAAPAPAPAPVAAASGANAAAAQPQTTAGKARLDSTAGPRAAAAGPVALAQETAKPAAGKRPTLLVMPLQAEASLAKSARAIDPMLLDAVSRLHAYQVVGSNDLGALLGVEKLKDAMGCNDVTCAAEIGGALGAPYLLTGELRSLGNQVVLSLMWMDTRKPAVLGRATARGPKTADALAQMLADAVGRCFKTTVHKATAVVAAPKPSPSYAAYTAMMMELGRRMSNGEYTALLHELDSYDKDTPPAPSGTDAHETLLYYRILACKMLARSPCVAQQGRRYLQQWPQGMYASAVQGYVDAIGDERLARQDAAPQLQAKLADIAAKLRRGIFDEPTALELQGYAYLAAKRWGRAAARLRQAIELRLHAGGAVDTAKVMTIVQSLVLALQQVGRFGECRAVLERAKKLDPRAFRRAGLQYTLRRLPK